MYLSRFYEDDLKSLLDPLKITEKELIFMPINDNSDFKKASGGSHWSLLVFNKAKMQFEYYDSAGIMNLSSAKATASKLGPLLQSKGIPIFTIMENCPQQQNMSDCGIYCLYFAEYLASAFMGKTDKSIGEEITPSSTKEKRSIILQIIKQLAEEKSKKK